MTGKTLTAPEAAKLMGLSQVRVYELIRAGQLVAHKDECRILRIDAESVAARKPGKPGRPPKRKHTWRNPPVQEQPEQPE